MHTLFLVLFIVGCASAYLGIGGFVGARIQRRLQQKCGPGGHAYCDHEVGAFFSGFFWPIALPLIAGMLVGGGSTGTRLSRADRRRAQELDEARHQTELARERERAAQALDRQERALGIR